MAREILVKRVGVRSLGRVVGTVQGLTALVFGVFIAVGGSIVVVQENNFSFFTNVFAVIGVTLASLVLYPLLMFIVGWIYGAIVALVVNLVFGAAGGLDLQVEDLSEAPAKK